jgi:Arc/MetJ family transcription regulator
VQTDTNREVIAVPSRTRSDDSHRNTQVVDGVDVETLAQAKTMLGASSPRDAVNEALREVVRQKLARQYVERVAEVSRTLGSPDELRNNAWRRRGAPDGRS